ncbi:hypothetical protein HK097_008589 [Rhizophlyctis rosea]|uniref:Uncharacterized protein n=1 Tax=Rhizophlyctis rosea TaxID=64517 RepID=A0AAD5SC96_9FUNG|nr:hypothetical protein HK097_008589 [Rhizophlyctis rosea]
MASRRVSVHFYENPSDAEPIKTKNYLCYENSLSYTGVKRDFNVDTLEFLDGGVGIGPKTGPGGEAIFEIPDVDVIKLSDRLSSTSTEGIPED